MCIPLNLYNRLVYPKGIKGVRYATGRPSTRFHSKTLPPSSGHGSKTQFVPLITDCSSPDVQREDEVQSSRGWAVIYHRDGYLLRGNELWKGSTNIFIDLRPILLQLSYKRWNAANGTNIISLASVHKISFKWWGHHVLNSSKPPPILTL